MDFSSLSEESAPFIRTELPGPESRNLIDYQLKHEGNAVSYPRGLPLALKRGKGATVEDVDGNIYIDFFGGAGVMNVGHGNPDVLEAARKQINDLTHALDLPNHSRKSLVEGLLSVLPGEISKVFFGGPTGSDAVESAVKLAKHNTDRLPVIAFEGSYHGMTAGALSLCSGSPFKEKFLPLVPETHFIPYAYCYRCAFEKEPDTCGIFCARYLEHILEDSHSGVTRPAAVIVEPVQGEGGSISPPDEFLVKIRDITERYGVLLITDEIQSGFCRTGKMFSFEHSGIIPDIITMSKALGGVGFPISGIAYKEKLDTWKPGAHIGTFRGNVTAYAAGNAALEFMLANDLADHSKKAGALMLRHLKEIKNNFIGDVRGRGMMLGVEFVKDKDTKEPAPEIAADVRTACFKKGLLIEIGGHYFNVARFLPPLIITEEMAIKGIDIFTDAVKEVTGKL